MLDRVQLMYIENRIHTLKNKKNSAALPLSIAPLSLSLCFRRRFLCSLSALYYTRVIYICRAKKIMGPTCGKLHSAPSHYYYYHYYYYCCCCCCWSSLYKWSTTILIYLLAIVCDHSSHNVNRTMRAQTLIFVLPRAKNRILQSIEYRWRYNFWQLLFCIDQ